MNDNQLLQDLSVILNAHQDIEDASKFEPVDLAKIKEANDRIGSTVRRSCRASCALASRRIYPGVPVYNQRQPTKGPNPSWPPSNTSSF